jgi:hypothetical protein
VTEQHLYSTDGRRRYDRDVIIVVMDITEDTAEAAPVLLFPFVVRTSTVTNGIFRITSITRISNHALANTPNRIGSRPPYHQGMMAVMT